ncbi:MAG: hypothetical protein LBK22_02775 [Tannerella sp.]|jgi:hypothetical protein|nr:hypothetical protein [Tannerella sp.]
MITEYADIRNVRPVAENIIDEKRIRPYIEEAERLYLVPAIGASLYKDISENRKNWETLFSGGYYNANRCHFAGLREAMGYLSYARFIRNNGISVTAFGVVVKQGEFSQPADEKTIVRISNDAEKIGREYLNQCIHWLRFEGIIKEKQATGHTKFKSIGR